MRRSAILISFVLGLGLGIAAPTVGLKYLRPFLPSVLQGKREALEGNVLEKQLQGGELLITIGTEEGVVLARFKRKVPEIDLLVSRTDQITIGVSQYAPFITDPAVLKVQKPTAAVSQDRRETHTSPSLPESAYARPESLSLDHLPE